MAFLRKYRKAGKDYFSIAYSIRITGQPYPVQRQLAWLGDAETAIEKLESGVLNLSLPDQEKMLAQLQKTALVKPSIS
ncbi:MAG: hypothetical protein KME07_06405 [Pegethrix bostrychoides GSE-TBD4-15B]|jgi:hypothetical protein|uniref:Uncharacterized protein n=1 Tax=Pegethrix bostrychoides GSE-TBD4-15B TaxID=2839662 RepID=A0A951P8N8_9CYAN|nr:hypothetical protein [Pegethrix bostrychoides GSE-TBD4-15B]